MQVRPLSAAGRDEIISHFSRIRTTFRHREVLIQCMQDLGYTVEVNTTIRGYHGEHNVDIAAKKSTGYGLGFVMNPAGTYDLIGDWWGVSGKSERKIALELKHQADTLQKEYAKKIVLEQTAADGFDLVSETEETDGTVRIVVRRWR